MTAPAPALVASLSAALTPTPGLVAAFLFGSEARGRAHRESDIDVGVVLDRAQYPHAAHRFDARLRLIGDLQIATHRTVDLLVLNDVPPLLARRVLLDGVRLVVPNASALEQFQRLVLSRAADLSPRIAHARRAMLETLAR
jgi:predicted nucleotidyltransferase